jgi:predicted negative regulator of RcsB-dependent stress response
MFNQVVADGANLFVIILAVIVGFASALGYIDYQKTTKNQQRPE